jgi:multidrug resistance protein, MATE family
MLGTLSPRLRELLTLAWPVVLSRSTQSIVGLADALMIAPLGTDALAATTTGAINTFSIAMLPFGTAFIVSSFSAQLTGRGDLVAARRYGAYALVLGAVAQALVLCALPFVGTILGVFDYAPAVHREMTAYMAIRLGGIGLVIAMEALGNWFAGTGNTQVQMRASVVVMLANIFLNWVFIYGNLGAPPMGVAGAALASALAGGLGFAWVLAAFWKRQREIAGGAPWALKRAEFVRMLRFGFPNGVNWFMEISAFTLFLNALVAPLGTSVLAAMNVIMQINSVSFMPAFGLASAGAVLVGQAIGREKHDEAGSIVTLTAKVALTWQLTVGLVYFLFPGFLIGFFAPPTGGEELVRIGAVMLMVSAAWQAFDAIGMTVGEALRAAGDTTWLMWIRVGSAWVVFLPLAWLVVLRLDGGALGAIWCVVAWLALIGVAFVLRFRSGAWRHIRLIEPDVLAPPKAASA